MDDEEFYKEAEARRRKRLLRFFFFLAVVITLFQIVGIIMNQGSDDLHGIYHYENGIPNSENQFFCNFSMFLNQIVVKFTIIALIFVMLLLLTNRPDFSRWLYLSFNAILVLALFAGMVNSIMTPSVIARYCFVN